jgi:hypothetical protein
MALATEKYDLDIANNIYASGQVISSSNNILNTLNNIQSQSLIQSRNLPINRVFSITRPNNSIAYGGNKILNALTTSSSLPSLDCGIGNAGKTIRITDLIWSMNDYNSIYPLNIVLFDTGTFTSQSVGDASSATMSNAEWVSHFLAYIPTISVVANNSSQFLAYSLSTINKPFVVPASGLIYLYITMGAFTPTPNEIYTLMLTGILN